MMHEDKLTIITADGSNYVVIGEKADSAFSLLLLEIEKEQKYICFSTEDGTNKAAIMIEHITKFQYEKGDKNNGR